MIQNSIDNLRQFVSKNCNVTIDPKLCDDITRLCDEVDRLRSELQKANSFMDDDFIVIERHKKRILELENRNYNNRT